MINMGRGGHVVDDDLLAAIDSGHLAGAALDVFNTEPLPTEHPYWTHPKVHITPHMAGYTNPRTASPGVIENIKRLRAGQPLINTVDPKSGTIVDSSLRAARGGGAVIRDGGVMSDTTWLMTPPPA